MGAEVRRLAAAAIALAGLLTSGTALAQVPTDMGSLSGLGCPKSGALRSGKMISDMCWPCIFPLRFGAPVTSKRFPSDQASPVCVCPSKALMGMPAPGVTFGMWKPTHVVESVRQPGCFPALDTSVKLGKVLSIGKGGEGYEDQYAGFTHVHAYTYPTGAILDMLTSAACAGNGDSFDIDIIALTEIDPTYVNDPLSMVVNPEAFLFNNPVAVSACMADAAAASIYRPTQALFWCFGSWGGVYPLSGHNNQRSDVAEASLDAAKLVAIQHKRLLMNKTYGNSAVCKSHPMPIYPKQQYRWQMLYPYPQRVANEWTGASTIPLREWRQIPVVGEDWVQVMSSYSECCVLP